MENAKHEVKLSQVLLALLPQQLRQSLALEEGDELEFSEATEGVWIVTKRGTGEAVKAFLEKEKTGEKAAGEKSFLNEKEITVLKKLESIKFEERLPALVNKTLTVAERKTLEMLIKKQFVTIYKEGKYAKNGVYNIPREVYTELRKDRETKKETAEGRAVNAFSFFEQNGYAVIESEDEAKNISSQLEEKIKAGEVVGARGFDRRYYIVRKNVLSSLSEKVGKAIEKGNTAGKVAEQLKISETLAKTILELMKYEGEAVEREKGLYYTC